MTHLLFMKVHAIPVMSQSSVFAFPVLQKGNCPEGHEHTKEHCARMVKQITHLKWEITIKIHISDNPCKTVLSATVGQWYLSHGANVRHIPGFAGFTKGAHKVAAPAFTDFFPMHNIQNTKKHFTQKQYF